MRVHLHSEVDGPRVSFDPDDLAREERPSTEHKGVRGWVEQQRGRGGSLRGEIRAQVRVPFGCSARPKGTADGL